MTGGGADADLGLVDESCITPDILAASSLTKGGTECDLGLVITSLSLLLLLTPLA